ncbi:MAG: GntR family transcriptional regulator [Bacillota bacterium]
MLDRDKYIPLYIQLKEELKDKIKNGVWEVDSQIPTEKSLMEEYEVGRATVREALALLVNEGYLYKKQGIGTFVARKLPSLGFEPLISLTYSLNIRGISSSNKVLEKRELLPDKHLLSRLKWKKQKSCFYINRVRYAENIPIALEHSYFSNEFEQYIEKLDLTGSFAQLILKELKITINKVEQTIIPRVPDTEEQRLLNIDQSTTVLNLERWIYANDNEEPFYYLKFIIPENIYTMGH